MSAVIGIDAGGTRSRAVLMGADGAELARAEGGPALLEEGGEADVARAVAALREVASAALATAGLPPPVACLHAALAGVGRERVRERIEAALDDALGVEAPPRERLADVVHVGTDVEAAFHAAFGTEAGLLLISGTGSIACGRGEDGRSARVGGWGGLLGDEGSGYRIGLDALRAAARSRDGRGEPSELEGVVFGMLELDAPSGLVDWAASATKRDIATLAPLAWATARTGDAAAAAIIEGAVVELERHVTALLERLGPWSAPPPLALAGGLLAPDGVLRERFLTAAAGLACRPVEAPVDAARGAALLARAAGRATGTAL